MAAQKVYQIQINGLTESVKAVDALNESLKTLEARIKALEGKTVSVGSKSSGGSSKASSLSEEEKLQKQINQLEEKQIAYSKEIYQNYLAAKDVLKETVKDQQQLAAAERVQANTYSNTMEGIKQKLADLKSVHFTTDISTDDFKKQTQEIDALTKKLKGLEEEYGVYTRNVGNYASAADGFKGLRYEIAGTVQEFDNAKQALKTFQGELRTLQVKKDQGMILSEEEAQRFKELPNVVAELKSSIQDAGKPMDALMDTMQSLVAMAQVSKGLSAFFGFDDSEIQRSIQQLLALQNALQGLQTIQKQLQSGEGIGKIFKEGDAAIKSFTDKLFGVDKSAKAASASIATVGTSGKAAATGLTTASVAANTTAKSFSLAAAGATLLRVALNAIGIGLIVGAIALAVEGIGKLIDKQQAAKKYQEDLNKAINEGNKEYAKASLEMSTLEKKLNNFNGTKKQEKQLVDELNRKYGDSIGQYKSVKEWKEAIIKKAAAYANALKTEAEAQALLNLYTKQFIELEEAKQKQQQKDSSWVGWLEKAVDTVAKGVTKVNKQWGALATQMSAGIHLIFDDNIDQMEANLEKTRELYDQKVAELEKIQADNELGNYAPTIEKNGKKTKDAVKKLQNEINQLELRLMEDGLRKRLALLDEEKRQIINKLKENGKATASEIKKVDSAFYQLRMKEINAYVKQLKDSVKQSAKEISDIKFELDTKGIEQQIKEITNNIERLKGDVPFDTKLETREDSMQERFPQTSGLDESIEVRLNGLKAYKNFRLKLVKKLINEEEKLLKDAADKEAQRQKTDYDEKIKNLEKQKQDSMEASTAVVAVQFKENRLLTEAESKKLHELVALEKELDKQIVELQKAKTKAVEQIAEDHELKIINITKESAEKRIKVESDYFDELIRNYRESLSTISALVQKQPVYDKNGWGIINKSETKKNLDEAKAAIKTLKADIIEQQHELDKAFGTGLLSPSAYNAIMTQINDIKASTKEAELSVTEDLENLGAEWWGSINMWIQQAGQALTIILDSISEITSNQYEKEIEQQEEYISKYEEMLDKQRDITQQYASEIDSIEDELATSRGDRRQHLIDQLNAEIEARRASAAEEKRLDRERQKAEDKKKKLEHDQAVAKKKMDLAQAAINAAMAISMAAVNHWPIPAVPMMAMAASVGAAQIAAIASQNIPSYAVGGQLEGGIAQGNRHRDGGIKVLGGRAEIEGGEFITNRISTEMNAPLLEFINSKKKKIDVSDLLEFYSSGSVKKNIMNMSPKTKFADGGYIPPTLSTTIEIEDKLLDSFERYSNRPVVVSVVDITSKQDDVRRVQTLAGL